MRLLHFSRDLLASKPRMDTEAFQFGSICMGDFNRCYKYPFPVEKVNRKNTHTHTIVCVFFFWAGVPKSLF